MKEKRTNELTKIASKISQVQRQSQQSWSSATATVFNLKKKIHNIYVTVLWFGVLCVAQLILIRFTPKHVGKETHKIQSGLGRLAHSIKLAQLTSSNFLLLTSSLLRASSRRGLNDIILILGYSHIVVVARVLSLRQFFSSQPIKFT